jgi:diketogulonate reductase-like aldo/keto reductase
MQVPNINLRIHPQLKQLLDEYCEENLEKISEAISSAIKDYIGFGNFKGQKIENKLESDEGKTYRLNIRVHPRLKKALVEYCKKNNENFTEAVTNAIKLYIGYHKKLG